MIKKTPIIEYDGTTEALGITCPKCKSQKVRNEFSPPGMAHRDRMTMTNRYRCSVCQHQWGERLGT